MGIEEIRRLKSQAAMPKQKKVYRIKPLSKKRLKMQVIYRKVIGKMAAVSELCEVNSPDCQGIMTGAQHKQKRSAKNLIDPKNLKRCCNGCQLYIELHPGWALKNGHSVSKFTPEVDS